MNVNQLRFEEACERWSKQGVRLDDGLRDSEIEELEQTYAFKFPPDLREFLQYRLPVGPRFLDWRNPKDDVKEALNWPISGILFDIETNGFWWAAWGPRPDRIVDALEQEPYVNLACVDLQFRRSLT